MSDYNDADLGLDDGVDEDAERTAQLQVLDLRSILEDARVRDFLWRVIQRCDIFVPGPSSALGLAHQAGKRDIGLMLLRAIEEADPEAVLKMQREARAKQESENGRGD